MQLIDPIPDPIYKKLNPLLEADEEIRIALESDIDAAGHFNPRWLVMTDRRVMTLGLNGNDQDLEVPLADLTKVQIEPLVGGSSLEVSTAEDTIPLITYSQSRTDKFIEASRGIEQFIENKPFLVKTTFPKVTCEKCGRRLPTKDGLCSACVSKWSMFTRICTYLTTHRTKTIVIVVMFLLISIADLLPPKITQLIIDDVFANKDPELLFWLVFLMGGLMVFRWFGEMVNGWLTAWLGARVVSDMRSEVYKHLELLSLGYHDKQRTGGLSW